MVKTSVSRTIAISSGNGVLLISSGASVVMLFIIKTLWLCSFGGSVIAESVDVMREM